MFNKATSKVFVYYGKQRHEVYPYWRRPTDITTTDLVAVSVRRYAREGETQLASHEYEVKQGGRVLFRVNALNWPRDFYPRHYKRLAREIEAKTGKHGLNIQVQYGLISPFLQG